MYNNSGTKIEEKATKRSKSVRRVIERDGLIELEAGVCNAVRFEVKRTKWDGRSKSRKKVD